MLRSMTAYGRGKVETKLGCFICEIQSVNRKHLEVAVFLPRELVRFDNQVKKWVNAVIGRGQVTVKFTAVFSENIPVSMSVNVPLAKMIQTAAKELASALELPDSRELTIKMLSEESNLIQFNDAIEDEDAYLEALRSAFDKAIQGFIDIKAQAGQEIFIDISQRLKVIHTEIKQIATYAPHATKRYREKLIESLKELSAGAVDDERILKEVGIYAERIDISEEITLFEDHLKRFSEVIAIKHEPVAKTLEFLLQELNREINTIGSKSSEMEVSRRVVGIKSELERIREIIQNVE